MDATIYQVSNQYVRWKTIRIVSFVMLIALGFGADMIYKHGWEKGASGAVFFIVMMGAMSAAVVYKRRERMAAMTCSMSETSLIRTIGDLSFSDDWQNFTSAIVVTDRTGKPAQVLLKRGPGSISLHGFEHMDELGDRILRLLPESAPIHRIAWYEPWVNSLAIFGGGALLIAGLSYYGFNKLIRRIDLLIPFGSGLFLLMKKPISSAVSTRRVEEVCLGIILFVCAVVAAVVQQ